MAPPTNTSPLDAATLPIQKTNEINMAVGPDGLTPAMRVQAALAQGRPPRRQDVERTVRWVFCCSKQQAKWFCSVGIQAFDPTRLGALAEALEKLQLSLRRE